MRKTICSLHRVRAFLRRRSFIYAWLSSAIQLEFEEVRPLKEGPRGGVFLLRHKKTGRLLVFRRFSGSGEVYRKLLRYSCPNLPEVLETAEQEGTVLVLEEFIQGDTLDFLLKAAPLSPKATREIIIQLCQALRVLHAFGAVHRDIKPENVILREREAVLIDFDAARLHKPAHENDTVVLGTTGFAAPEQYGLSQSGPQADIYSLGVLMNVMLTGEHPSRKLADGRLGRVVQRCTQVNPEKRYRSAIHLMEAIQL